jgi:hypothetical protein
MAVRYSASSKLLLYQRAGPASSTPLKHYFAACVIGSISIASSPLPGRLTRFETGQDL